MSGLGNAFDTFLDWIINDREADNSVGGGGTGLSEGSEGSFEEDIHVRAPSEGAYYDPSSGWQEDISVTPPPGWETPEGRGDGDLNGGGGGWSEFDPIPVEDGPANGGEIIDPNIDQRFDDAYPGSELQFGENGISFQSPAYDDGRGGLESYIDIYGSAPQYVPNQAPHHVPEPHAPSDQPVAEPQPVEPSTSYDPTPHSPDVWGNETTNPTGSQGEWAGEGDNKTKAYEETTTEIVNVYGEEREVTTITYYNSNGQIIGTHSSYTREYTNDDGIHGEFTISYDQTSPDQPWNHNRSHTPADDVSTVPPVGGIISTNPDDLLNPPVGGNHVGGNSAAPLHETIPYRPQNTHDIKQVEVHSGNIGSVETGNSGEDDHFSFDQEENSQPSAGEPVNIMPENQYGNYHANMPGIFHMPQYDVLLEPIDFFL